LRDAAVLISFFDMLGLSLLLFRVSGFVASFHGRTSVSGRDTLPEHVDGG
jgi:hypothetical protein